MGEVRFMRFRKVCKLIALASLAASTSAFGSFGAHYLGASRDHAQFRMYLDGGEFLGRMASFQTIRVTVHQLRQGRPMRVLAGCVYRFDDMNRRNDRIECAARVPGPLRGVAYARDPKEDGKGVDELEPMVCVRRCGGQVPQRLNLEAEEDNH